MTFLDIPDDVLCIIARKTELYTLCSFVTTCKAVASQKILQILDSKVESYSVNKLHNIMQSIKEYHEHLQSKKEEIVLRILESVYREYNKFSLSVDPNGYDIAVVLEMRMLRTCIASVTGLSFQEINMTWNKVLSNVPLDEDETIAWQATQETYIGKEVIYDVLFSLGGIYFWLIFDFDSHKLQFHINDVSKDIKLYDTKVWEQLNMLQLRTYTESCLLEVSIDETNVDESIKNIITMITKVYGKSVLLKSLVVTPRLNIVSMKSDQVHARFVDNSKYLSNALSHSFAVQMEKLNKILKMHVDLST